MSKKLNFSFLKKGLQLNEFKLIKELGKGGAGVVWEAEVTIPNKTSKDVKTSKLKIGEHVALKIGDTAGILFHEAHVRRQLGDIEGLYKMVGPEVVDNTLGIKYLPMELYETTLGDYASELTSEEIFNLISNIIVTLFDIHEKGYIFRDISRNNIMKNGDKWILIDVGIATKLGIDKKFSGTFKYSAIDTLLGSQPHYYDDLESLGYVMLELFTDLPWKDVKEKTTLKFYKEEGEKRKEQTLSAIKNISNKSVQKKLKKYFTTIYKLDKTDTIDPDIYQELIDILMK